MEEKNKTTIKNKPDTTTTELIDELDLKIRNQTSLNTLQK